MLGCRCEIYRNFSIKQTLHIVDRGNWYTRYYLELPHRGCSILLLSKNWLVGLMQKHACRSIFVFKNDNLFTIWLFLVLITCLYFSLNGIKYNTYWKAKMILKRITIVFRCIHLYFLFILNLFNLESIKDSRS